MRKNNKPKEKKLGEILLEDMNALVRENIYPVFHGKIKPIFERYPDILSIDISTATDYNDEYSEMFPLYEGLITVKTADHGVWEYDQKAFGYSDEGRLSNWRNAAWDYDEQEDEDDELHDENGLPNDLPASCEPAMEMLLEVLRQFELEETALIFGIDGSVEVKPDSITVTGSHPAIENPNW